MLEMRYNFYFTDATALPNAAFGQGSGAIVLDNVACTGSEGSLVNCPYDPHTADCFHSQDASVRCSIAARMLDSARAIESQVAHSTCICCVLIILLQMIFMLVTQLSASMGMFA